MNQITGTFPAKALFSALLLLLSPLSLAATEDGDKIYTGWFSDVAIKGYDPVAYFTVGKPTKGDDSYSSDWSGATWHFASAANKAKFDADPGKYAPQYGGHCAYAIAKGDLVSIDPKAWAIVDDKLYLNYSAKIQRKWQADQSQFIVKADQRWPQLRR